MNIDKKCRLILRNTNPRESGLRIICVSMVAILILSLIPILMVGKYNVPAADDYLMLKEPLKQFVAENGNPLSAIRIIWEKVSAGYTSWQGTFSYYILNAVASLIGLTPENGYSTVNSIMLIVFLIGVFSLCYSILRLNLKMRMEAVVALFVLVSITVIELLPSPVEAFFWFNGSSLYTGIFAIAMGAIAYFLFLTSDHCKCFVSIHILCLSLMLIFVGGGNYPTALCCVLVVGLIELYKVLFQREYALRGILPAIAVLIALIINVTAPGNSIRLQQEQVAYSGGVLHSIYICFLLGFQYIREWTTLSVIVLAVGVGIWAWIGLRNADYKFNYPVLWTCVTVGIYSASFAPTAYSYGWIGPPRYMNVVFYFYVFMLFSNVIYYVGYFSNMHRVSTEKKEKKCRNITIILLSLLLFIDCSPDHYIKNQVLPEHTVWTTATAIKDLLIGKPQEYLRYHQNRNNLLRVSEEKTMLLDACPEWCKSELLYFDDITTDPNDWKNILYAQYYKKDSVAIAK